MASELLWPCRSLQQEAEYCIQKFPRFGRYFSDSYRSLPTATEFYPQLPNFTYSYRFSPTKNDRFFRQIHFTSEQLCLVYVHPLPFPQPPNPVLPPQDPAPLLCLAGPVELRLLPPATCTKQLKFTDTATSYSYQIFPTEVPSFTNSYRILWKEIPTLANRDT